MTPAAASVGRSSIAVRLTAPRRDDGVVRAMASVLRGDHLAARGPVWTEARERVGATCGVPCIALTSSGTSALEIGAMALDMDGNAEVIVPSFTFVTTASAFVRRGARVVFADIDPLTLTLDPASIADRASPQTAAIVAMHYAGVACDMAELARLADAYGAALVEDNAHGFAGQCDGRPLGSYGRFSIVSFDWSKNVTCGEGGGILSADPELTRRIEMICDRGTDRREFERGERDRYEWVGIGTNADLSELSAAFLNQELIRIAEIQAQRRWVWEAHQERLAPWARTSGAQLPFVPDRCDPAYHLFYVVIPAHGAVAPFIAHMAAAGVEAAFHYSPLHLAPFGRALGGRLGQCPVTESIAPRLVRIPCHQGLSATDLERIHQAVTSFKA